MKFILLIALAIMPGIAFAQTHLIQYPDIAEIIMKKYQLNVENTDFTIFYRFSTGGEGGSSSEDETAKISSIEINKEKKAMVISLDEINQDDLMSIRFSEKLVSAQGQKLILLIDGKEKAYEFNTQDEKRTMVFMLPANSKQIEIVGTRVIPEFASSLVILTVIMSCVIFASIILNRRI